MSDEIDVSDLMRNNIFKNFKSVKELSLQKSKEFAKVLGKYWAHIVVVILIFYIIVIFVLYWPSIRIPRLLKRLDTYQKFVNLQSCSICNKYLDSIPNDGIQQNNSEMDGTLLDTSCQGVFLPYRLADFYVSSSYRSCMIGYNRKDYVSEKAISKLLKGGCRFIDLDIFPDSYQCESKDLVPIVTNGKMPGLYNYMYNYVTFEDCCKEIARCAFSSNCVENYNDPLFLNLRLHIEGNTILANKIADIYFRHFKSKILSKRYSYQKQNLGRIPINLLFDKIILLCDKDFKNTKLDELVNATTSNSLMRSYNYNTLVNGAPSYDFVEVTNFNRTQLTIIYPDESGRIATNYSPNVPWFYGCQFVCMHWQTIGENMSNYITKFKNHSFILKPCKLRYKAPVYKKPEEQSPQNYFNNMEINTPFYSTKI